DGPPRRVDRGAGNVGMARVARRGGAARDVGADAPGADGARSPADGRANPGKGCGGRPRDERGLRGGGRFGAARSRVRSRGARPRATTNPVRVEGMTASREQQLGMDRPHAVVIGGGLAGLAAAVELTTLGARVTLIERNAHLGGKMNVHRE